MKSAHSSRNSCRPGRAHSDGGNEPAMSGLVSTIATLSVQLVTQTEKRTVVKIEHEQPFSLSRFVHHLKSAL